MSHIADVDVCVNDLDALEEVCKRRGWVLRRNETTYRWVGRWFDDSPVPKSLFTDDAEYRRVVSMTKVERKRYMEAFLGRCAHRIEIPGHTCQVGVVQVGDDLKLAWDWASSLQTVLGHVDSWNRNNLTNLSPFLQEYCELSLTSLLTAESYSLTEKNVLEDGSLLLQYETN